MMNLAVFCGVGAGLAVLILSLAYSVTEDKSDAVGLIALAIGGLLLFYGMSYAILKAMDLINGLV